MKNPRFERYIYAGVTAFAVLAAAILLIFGFLERAALARAWSVLVSILAPVIYGAVLAFLLAPIYNRARDAALRLLGGKSGKSSLAAAKAVGTVASAVVLFAVVAGFCRLVLPQLYSTIVGIISMMPVYAQNIQDLLANLFENNPDLEATVIAAYQQGVTQFMTWLTQDLLPNLQNAEVLNNLKSILGDVSIGVANVYKILSNTLIGLIVMLYLLNIKETLTAQAKKLAYAFLPTHIANETIDEFRYIHQVFSGFIIGKIIDSIIIGILCFILMKIIKLPFEVLVSVIVGVTNVIPFFGPFIGAIPSAILIFLISPLQCCYFVLMILALQQFDGNILGPKILGDSTGLSSFWVLFSILFFGGLLGFAGMIIAVPLTAVIFDLVSRLQKHYLRKKNLSPDTESYLDLDRIDEESGEYVSHGPR